MLGRVAELPGEEQQKSLDVSDSLQVIAMPLECAGSQNNARRIDRSCDDRDRYEGRGPRPTPTA